MENHTFKDQIGNSSKSSNHTLKPSQLLLANINLPPLCSHCTVHSSKTGSTPFCLEIKYWCMSLVLPRRWRIPWGPGWVLLVVLYTYLLDSQLTSPVTSHTLRFQPCSNHTGSSACCRFPFSAPVSYAPPRSKNMPVLCHSTLGSLQVLPRPLPHQILSVL